MIDDENEIEKQRDSKIVAIVFCALGLVLVVGALVCVFAKRPLIGLPIDAFALGLAPALFVMEVFCFICVILAYKKNTRALCRTMYALAIIIALLTIVSFMYVGLVGFSFIASIGFIDGERNFDTTTITMFANYAMIISGFCFIIPTGRVRENMKKILNLTKL